ncbi:hypothetical protein [Chitinophaga pinensis]|uniref:Uncharacterized protein n=1 Tax=Chitinophaga pinensis (strain ATCC 43595 / DSM 2588 / LMG 13176 / NBRC 15968 / NCIMB 11800 / UQM 2034) TaxID=485918 RepID=A0A979G4G1_CHIPD|nr:hypothetical protein [Chitinophaga pinensis]ACU60506.1 hypothetical protein Cpin_3031 [Chitinophaga pinensis DSM 2588]
MEHPKYGPYWLTQKKLQPTADFMFILSKTKAVKNYNGGGNEYYVEQIEQLLKKAEEQYNSMSRGAREWLSRSPQLTIPEHQKNAQIIK